VQTCTERVVVTGGSGFIGTNLVEALIARGVSVVSVDSKEPPCDAHRSVWHRLDVTDSAGVVSLLRDTRPTHIYHLGARTDLGSNDVADYPENTEGTRNVVMACMSTDSIRRLVHVSSELVCRLGYRPASDTDYCPTTAYGESKVISEEVVRELKEPGFEWVIVRPTSIWGPWFHVPYRDFFEAIRRRLYVHPRGETIRKSFGYFGNSVFQLQKLMDASPAQVCGRTFYICDYEPIELGAFARGVADAFGVRPPVAVPTGLLIAVAKVGDMMTKLGYRTPPSHVL
jgi:nucleoside-diphosphate-sugar epimerase